MNVQLIVSSIASQLSQQYTVEDPSRMIPQTDENIRKHDCLHVLSGNGITDSQEQLQSCWEAGFTLSSQAAAYWKDHRKLEYRLEFAWGWQAGEEMKRFKYDLWDYLRK